MTVLKTDASQPELRLYFSLTAPSKFVEELISVNKVLIPYFYIMPSLYLCLDNHYIKTNGDLVFRFCQIYASDIKSGNLKLLETSGPVQACKEVALPHPVYPAVFSFISCERPFSSPNSAML